MRQCLGYPVQRKQALINVRIRATEQEGGSEIRLAGHSRFFPTMLQDELRRLGEALSHER